jgi:tryptophan synthase beta chain
VLNHVCLHQTVIGQEAIKQMELAGEEPDVHHRLLRRRQQFRRARLPVHAQEIKEKKKYRIVAVEPSACPSLTKGELRYDFGDTAETTPLLMMYTLGHKFMPPSIHAGGLRYHGMSPMVSHALKLGLIEAEAYHQTKVFEAATLFARTKASCPRRNPPRHRRGDRGSDPGARGRPKRVILFNLSGHGTWAPIKSSKPARPLKGDRCRLLVRKRRNCFLAQSTCA